MQAHSAAKKTALLWPIAALPLCPSAHLLSLHSYPYTSLPFLTIFFFF